MRVSCHVWELRINIMKNHVRENSGTGSKDN